MDHDQIKQSIILIEGNDKPGLIHNITGIILQFGFNIISNHEFVEPESNKFFMRSEVVGNSRNGEFLFRLEEILDSSFKVKIIPKRKKKIVVFVSREHHCLADLLIREEYGNLNADILAIISNYSELASLATKFNKKFHYIANANKSREEHEEEILDVLTKYPVDYLILAKYMRILSPALVSRYHQKIINIHHSFLPAFIGKDPYEQAYLRGVKIIGATAHYVNEELDEGPIIIQNTVPINHKYTIDDMKQAGRDVESLALSQALKVVFEDRIFINRNRTIILD